MANKIWNSNISLEERKQIIDRILDFKKKNKWFDDSDLAYFVKMLLEKGCVYVSEKAFEVIRRKNCKCQRFSDEVIDCWKNGCPAPGYLQGKTHNTRRLWGRSSELVWEHVVPTKVLLRMMKDENKDLGKILELGMVCIVLKKEDRLLTRAKLKDSMPEGWDKECAWARYKKAGIKVKGVRF